MSALSATIEKRQRRASVTAVASTTAVIAGLLVGITEGLFFALALARFVIQGLVWQRFGWAATNLIEPALLGVAMLTPLLSGVAFGRLLQRTGRTGSGWWRHALIGPYLWLSSTVGVVVASSFEPLAKNHDDVGVQLVFRAGFTLASGLAALLCTGATALTLRLERPVARAAIVGLVTAGTYLVVTSLLGLMPNWHVGSGDMAMPRIAMVANLIAGTIGGATAFRLLSR